MDRLLKNLVEITFSEEFFVLFRYNSGSDGENTWKRDHLFDQSLIGEQHDLFREPAKNQIVWRKRLLQSLPLGPDAHLSLKTSLHVFPKFEKLWNLAIKDQNAQALQAQDMLIVHKYAGTATTAVFAERYAACAIAITSLSGEGGGNIGMPIEVTYGGARTTGTAAIASGGAITFTPDT